ncbi:hypothetical protein QJS10_CPA16g01459 [Acorus calamus]|uniref:Putative plant transposon protein domain-containing protein n=1 Tax=Acorus calamus TaxID=4465 RepID=A0AAV9CZG8_ACOCL|nr:hypothetical protein QJS10_CPA16g01459 [Acorus calamus]
MHITQLFLAFVILMVNKKLPKRARETFSSSDANIFYDRKAKKAFDKLFSKRSLILEREIVLEKIRDIPSYHNIWTMFQSRGWMDIASLGNVAYPNYVHLFYANIHDILPDNRTFRTYLNGKYYTISTQTIAEQLNIPREPNAIYYKKLSALKTTISEEICVTELEYYTTIQQSQLKPIYRILNTIISHNIVPMGHKSDVTEDRAKLLYMIGTNAPIDLPNIIFDVIVDASISQSSTDSLPFSVFISNMIKSSGVEIPSNETKAYSKSPIDDSTVKRSEGQLRKKLGAGASTSAAAASTQATNNPTMPFGDDDMTMPDHEMSTGEMYSLLCARLDSLDSTIDVRFNKIESRMDTFEASMNSRFDHVDDGLSEVRRALGLVMPGYNSMMTGSLPTFSAPRDDGQEEHPGPGQ